MSWSVSGYAPSQCRFSQAVSGLAKEQGAPHHHGSGWHAWHGFVAFLAISNSDQWIVLLRGEPCFIPLSFHTRVVVIDLGALSEFQYSERQRGHVMTLHAPRALASCLVLVHAARKPFGVPQPDEQLRLNNEHFPLLSICTPMNGNTCGVQYLTLNLIVPLAWTWRPIIPIGGKQGRWMILCEQ